jgi:hypothetical protein
VGKRLWFYKLCATKAGSVDGLGPAVEAYNAGEDGVEELVDGITSVGGTDLTVECIGAVVERVQETVGFDIRNQAA